MKLFILYKKTISISFSLLYAGAKSTREAFFDTWKEYIMYQGAQLKSCFGSFSADNVELISVVRRATGISKWKISFPNSFARPVLIIVLVPHSNSFGILADKDGSVTFPDWNEVPPLPKKVAMAVPTGIELPLTLIPFFHAVVARALSPLHTYN